MKNKVCGLVFALVILTVPVGAKNFYSSNGIIRIIEAKDELRIIFPKTTKADLINVLSTFFAQGDEEAKKHFEMALKRSKNITMILTTVLDTRDYDEWSIKP